MSSISPNPNPNSEIFKIEAQEEEIEENPKPNWLELPEDVWFMILSKLKTIDIIEKVEPVCKLFSKIYKQPAMFKIIDLYRPGDYMDLDDEVNSMTRLAVDRSARGLVDITLRIDCDDHTLMYIVNRSKNLKRLVLVLCVCISDECLIEAVKKLPMLEELQLVFCKFSGKTVEVVGRACPSLKSFSLNPKDYKDADIEEFGNYALAIARSMPQLRYLQLIGNYMSDEGLKAILDGCLLLESLDLRTCFPLNLSEDLSKRYEKIKRVGYYPWQTYLAGYNEWNEQDDSDDDCSNRQEEEYDNFYGLDADHNDDNFDGLDADHNDFFFEGEDYRSYLQNL